MGNNWLKRIILLITPIIFYIAGLYCVDLLVQNHVIPSKIGKTQYDLFLVATCTIIELFLLLLVIITNSRKDFTNFSEFGAPIFVMIMIMCLESMNPMPTWVTYIFYIVPLAAIVYMIFIIFRYTTIPFENKIWKLKGVNSIWIFNHNKSMNLCSSDGKTSFFIITVR